MKKTIFILIFSIFLFTWVNAELINTEEPRMCTMEYAPVCAQVQVQCIKAPCNPILQTFWNSCMAWDNKIVYKWECNTKLSENDINFYNSIKTSKLEDKYQDRVYDLLTKFWSMLSRYSNENKIRSYNLMLRLVDKYTNDIVQSYPQDIAMPKNANIKYLMLKLLKFELLISNNK